MGYPIFYVVTGKLEPIAVALSGGQCLPPVQKLVATLIFARPPQGQKCKSSLGSEPTAAGGGVKGGERVAAVGVQRSRSDGKAHTGHRNRTPAPLNRPLLIQFASPRVAFFGGIDIMQIVVSIKTKLVGRMG